MSPLTELLADINFPFGMPSPHEPGPGELADPLASLAAFLAEHRRCGELDIGLEGEYVWMRCSCGAVIRRHQDD